MKIKMTKVVCTIGPKTESVEMLTKLVESGMNVMRLNFSHGDFEEHGQRIKNIREVMKKTGREVGILLDTKGPEIRTGKLEGGKDVLLETGKKVTITTDYSFVGNADKFAVSYPGIVDDLYEGTTVLLDDIADFGAVNEIYANYFVEPFPARSAFAVDKLPKNVLVEIEAIAYCGK